MNELNPSTQGATRVPTNLRMLAILEIFANESRAMTPTEVNQSMGLPKQSIHRLCNTLLEEGYLTRDSDPKRLRPARRMRLMASGILGLSHKHITRHQILQRVAKETGETINFAVAELEGMTYLDRIETDWPLRIQFPIGSHVPFHCTASGKTFLASLGPAARKRLISQLSLEAYTENTITDPAQLGAHIESVCEAGYAVDHVEFIPHLIAIAVPIRDVNGNFCAAIGCQAPQQRHSIEDLIGFEPLLQDAAQALAQTLFD